MLRIPFEGPSLEGRLAVVSTRLERLRGVVVSLGPRTLSLSVDGTIRTIPTSDVRVISPA